MFDVEDLDDLEDSPEAEEGGEEILDQATAARSIGELKAALPTLDGLETLANSVRRSGADRKWKELARARTSSAGACSLTDFGRLYSATARRLGIVCAGGPEPIHQRSGADDRALGLGR
jgi:hypothetical protein